MKKVVRDITVRRLTRTAKDEYEGEATAVYGIDKPGFEEFSNATQVQFGVDFKVRDTMNMNEFFDQITMAAETKINAPVEDDNG